MEDFYCKLFIDTKMDKAQLVREFAFITGGRIERYTVISSVAEFDIENNEDFSSSCKSDDPLDAFLYYPYYIDVYPNSESNFLASVYIQHISMVIESLWVKNYKIVAACDFEESLPRGKRCE